MKKSVIILTGFLFIFIIANCSELKKALAVTPETPTQDRMKGTWKVVEAYDELDSSIQTKISFPVAAFSFQDYDGFQSTANPLAMYLVYGNSNLVTVMSDIELAFDYAKLLANGTLPTSIGDWIFNAPTDKRFTLKFRLSGFPGQKAIKDVLSLIPGINNTFLTDNMTVYHRFEKVKVDFLDGTADTMVLTLDDSTTTSYYTLNASEDKTPWLGWMGPFHKCHFKLARVSISLDSLVRTIQTPHL
ncbi:MAG: hypothetical protein V1913_07760 [Fibrobacterota bacterium]